MLVASWISDGKHTPSEKELHTFLLVVLCSGCQTVELDRWRRTSKCLHHQFESRLCAPCMPLNLLVQEFECFKSGLRVVAVIEQRPHDHWKSWMDTPRLEGMDRGTLRSRLFGEPERPSSDGFKLTQVPLH